MLIRRRFLRLPRHGFMREGRTGRGIDAGAILSPWLNVTMTQPKGSRISNWAGIARVICSIQSCWSSVTRSGEIPAMDVRLPARFHHKIWNLAGNRTSIAGISPDLVTLLQQDWIEQITRAIPAQLLILDPFGCVIVTLSHGLSMAPASIPRPVRPSLMKPCLGNLKNLLRISIIR